MYATAVVASVPVGDAVDRVVVRRAVTAAAVALFVAGVLGWVAAGAGAYWVLVASRVLGGLSYVTIWNAGADLASRSVPAHRRATAVGVFTASAPAGFALGQFGGPFVEAASGWPAIFPTFGALSVLGLALYLGGTRRLRRTGGGPAESETPSLSQFREVLVNPRVWLVCGMGFAGFSLYLFLNSWLPSFLVDRFAGIGLGTAGLLAALFPAVGIVARTAGGAMSDRVFGGRRRPVALLSFAASAPLVVGIAVVGEVVVVVALLTAAGAAIQLGLGLLFSYVREVVPDAVGATAVSMLTSVGLLGAFAAPIAAGALIQSTGGYWTAFAGAAGVALAGAAMALAAPEPGR
jgi:nitrate/nitrite transporter NarK